MHEQGATNPVTITIEDPLLKHVLGDGWELNKYTKFRPSIEAA